MTETGCLRLGRTVHYTTAHSGGTVARDNTAGAELIEDFEYPICQFCLGIGYVRDENGIHMVRCHYCEGTGRAPTPE